MLIFLERLKMVYVAGIVRINTAFSAAGLYRLAGMAALLMGPGPALQSQEDLVNPVFGEPGLPRLTLGFSLGASLHANYGYQQIETTEIDHTYTELKPALGLLLEYRKRLLAYETNILFSRRELYFALRGDPNDPRQWYGNGPDVIALSFPIRVSKLIRDRRGHYTNKIFGGLSLTYLFRDRALSYNFFRPDIPEAVGNSINRVRPQLNAGYEKFLGRLGLQMDVAFAPWPADKKIRLQGRSIRSERNMLTFSLVLVYRFYRRKKDFWY